MRPLNVSDLSPRLESFRPARLFVFTVTVRTLFNVFNVVLYYCIVYSPHYLFVILNIE